MSRLSDIITRFIDFFYIPPVRRYIPRDVFRYAACGGLNMVLGWALYYIFNHYVIAGRFIDLGFMVVSPYTATLYSIVPFTFLAGFYLNRNVAFTRSPLRTRTQFARYLLMWAGSLAINHLLLKLFVEIFGIWYTPSHILATLIIAVYSFLIQKYFTFRGSNRAGTCHE